MKVIKLFVFLLLFVGAAVAEVLPLQCKSDDFKVFFSCDGWIEESPSGVDDEKFIISPCVAPAGYAFGGWKMDGMGAVLNVATIMPYLLGKNTLQDPSFVGDLTLVANWVPIVDVDSFSVKELVSGVMYNPELNRVYYEFSSGGIVLKTVCSSESEGDGSAVINIGGDVETMPTATKAVDLSKPGNYCWYGVEEPYGTNNKYVSVGSYSDCENECPELLMIVPLYRYIEPAYASLYDSLVSQMLKVLLGK